MMLKIRNPIYTVAGREIMEEGRQEGQRLGREVGKQEAVVDMASRLASSRFPQLPKTLAKAIAKLDYLQAEALTFELFKLDSIDGLRAWLAARKA